MKLGKIENLNMIIDKLLEDSNGTLSGCVVTNERGLVVAGKTIDGSSNQTLAAMVSILSDAAVRTNENLGLGHPKGIIVKTLGSSIVLREFKVQNRWFRIGAVLTDEGLRRYYIFKRRIDHERTESDLRIAADRVRQVLESS